MRWAWPRAPTVNWLAGPALAQPTSVTQIGAARSPMWRP